MTHICVAITRVARNRGRWGNYIVNYIVRVDTNNLPSLRAVQPNNKNYDIVYSWNCYNSTKNKKEFESDYAKYNAIRYRDYIKTYLNK